MKQRRKIVNVSLGAGLIILLCLAFLMSRAAQDCPTCVPAPLGLVSWWDGDDVSGTTAFDIHNGNNGTLNGVTFVPGMVGDAFKFSSGGYIRVPNDAILEVENVTVDAWVRSTSPGTYGYIVAKGAYDCTAASYALYTGGGSRLYFYIYNSVYVLSPSPSTSIWDGAWHHIAGTYDGEYVRLYVDGVEVGGGTYTTMGIRYGGETNSDLNIGIYRGTCTLPFSGEIDEVEVFNRALLDTEIWEIYNAGSIGKCKLIYVDIDIKPGSDPNAINLGSQGVIPVAILSSPDFDATTVDPTTVLLEGSEVAIRGKSDKYMAHEEDVNGDGLIDLVVKIDTENLDPNALQDGDAVLTGLTCAGHFIEGTDQIIIVPY